MGVHMNRRPKKRKESQRDLKICKKNARRRLRAGESRELRNGQKKTFLNIIHKKGEEG